MKASAPGKLILFGEHSVVFGMLGLATAIEPRTTVSVKDSGDLIKIEFPQLKLRKNMPLDEAKQVYADVEAAKNRNDSATLLKILSEPQKAIACVALRAMNSVGRVRGIEIMIESDLPAQVSLGLSASISTALAAAILGDTKDQRRISEIALFGDFIAHGGVPSGIDTTTTTYGGYVQFKKAMGPKPLKLAAEVPLVIGSTQLAVHTGEQILSVKKLKEQKAKEVDAWLWEMNQTAEDGIKALQNNNFEELAFNVNKNQELLRHLRVSHGKIEDLILAAMHAGAPAAKLSGAGGGGVMFALCTDEAQQKDIAAAIEKAGGRALLTRTGVQGVRMEK